MFGSDNPLRSVRRFIRAMNTRAENEYRQCTQGHSYEHKDDDLWPETYNEKPHQGRYTSRCRIRREELPAGDFAGSGVANSIGSG